MSKFEFSASGLELLKSLEGYRSKPYADSAGKMTIGYGHLIKAGDGIATGDIIGEAQAVSLLRQDVASAVACVNGCVTSSINQNMFDALVIFAFNVGNHALQNSTLLERLNKGDYSGAAEQFLVWCKIHTKQGAFVELPGLRNRREAERKLFLTPVETNHELA